MNDRLVRIKSLDAVRVLSDPFRSELLGRFQRARTVKEVADDMGVPVTRLYHHVTALEEVGLLDVVSTRQVRGTTERRYRAVGTRFAVDPVVFEGSDDPALARYHQAIAPAIDTAASEIVRSLRHRGSSPSPDEPFVLAHFFANVPRERLQRLIARLQRWAQDASKSGKEADSVPYGALVIFYPRDISSE